jgi:hypothetical protein
VHWVLTKKVSIMTFCGPIRECRVSNYFFCEGVGVSVPKAYLESRLSQEKIKSMKSQEEFLLRHF